MPPAGQAFSEAPSIIILQLRTIKARVALQLSPFSFAYSGVGYMK